MTQSYCRSIPLILATLGVVVFGIGCSQKQDKGSRGEESNTTSATDDKADDKDPDKQQEQAGNDVVEIPVPIFLTDPGTQLSELGKIVEEAAAPELQMPPSQAGGGGPEAAPKAAFQVYVDTYKIGYDLVRDAVLVLVNDAFGGEAAKLPGGAATVFDVRGLAFPPQLDLSYVRISIVSEVEKTYLVEGYCLRKTAMKECLSISFADKASGKSSRTELTALWDETATSTAGSWTLRVDYGGGDLVRSALRRVAESVTDADFAFGVTVPATVPENRRFVTLATLTNKDLPSAKLFPDLPRSRFSSPRRKAGDLFVIQSVGDLSSGEWARRTAFVATEDRDPTVVVSVDAYKTDSGERHMQDVIIALTRDPLTNEDCATTGVTLRNAYVGSPVPTVVSSLPDNICAGNSIVTNAAVLATFGQVCQGSVTVDLSLVINRSEGFKASIEVCVYQGVLETQVNPQYFVTTNQQRLQLDTAVPPSATHEALAAELGGQTATFSSDAMSYVSTRDSATVKEADLQAVAVKVAP